VLLSHRADIIGNDEIGGRRGAHRLDGLALANLAEHERLVNHVEDSLLSNERRDLRAALSDDEGVVVVVPVPVVVTVVTVVWC